MAEETKIGTRCSDGGSELPPDPPGAERVPCPTCGSTKRLILAPPIEVSATFRVTASGTVIRTWDGASLTLFGVLYGILATVAGVVVAMVGGGGSWLWWAIYAIVAVGALALILLVVPQYAIRGMRWLVERAKRAPLGRR